MAQVLVAVAAHADDAELNAGGTLAKWAAAGGAVHIIMATDNCSGSMIPPCGDERAARRLPPAETMAIRRREQEAAAALIGAGVHYLDYPQRHYWDGARVVTIGYGDVPPAPSPIPQSATPTPQSPINIPQSAIPTPHAAFRIPQLPPLVIAFQQPEHVARLADLIVSLKPDLVLTQTPLDLDPEHHAVASMVWQAFRLRKQELSAATLRFWTPGSSCQDGLLDPGYDHIEDISAFFEAKLRLCLCHRSQMTSLRLEMVKGRAALWGQRIGVTYAEPSRTANP